MSEYNQRQLKLMYKKIELYEQKKISLKSLVDSLEALLNALEGSGGKQEDSLWDEWAHLEIVYSVSVVQQQGSLSDQGNDRISQALTNLQQKITAILSH